jgi:hypothetical protein
VTVNEHRGTPNSKSLYCSNTVVAISVWIVSGAFLSVTCCYPSKQRVGFSSNSDSFNMFTSRYSKPRNSKRPLLSSLLSVVICYPFADATYHNSVLHRVETSPLNRSGPLFPFYSTLHEIFITSGRTRCSTTVLNPLLALSRCPFTNPISKYMQFTSTFSDAW